MALNGPDAYAAVWPSCDYLLADANCGGAMDVFDIDAFVLCLMVGGCSPCP